MRNIIYVLIVAGVVGILFPRTAIANSADVSIRMDNQFRYIESNGIPDHDHGEFPNKGNPNAISAQSYKFRIPLNPTRSSKPTPLTNQYLFGVVLNGVPFDPGTAEFYNNDRSSGWNYEALSGAINLGLDQNNAHVQPNGAYHYHGIPKKSVRYHYQSRHSILVGYAADGFPIYAIKGWSDPEDNNSSIVTIQSSYELKQGMRKSGPKGSYDGTFVQDYEYVEGSGDLDQCNGRFGVVPGYPDGIYHYFITDTFPYVPRCFVGRPDESFRKSAPHGGANRRGLRRDREQQMQGPDRPRGKKPPQEALDACRSKRKGSSCQVKTPHGSLMGICRKIKGDMACVPLNHR